MGRCPGTLACRELTQQTGSDYSSFTYVIVRPDACSRCSRQGRSVQLNKIYRRDCLALRYIVCSVSHRDGWGSCIAQSASGTDRKIHRSVLVGPVPVHTLNDGRSRTAPQIHGPAYLDNPNQQCDPPAKRVSKPPSQRESVLRCGRLPCAANSQSFRRAAGCLIRFPVLRSTGRKSRDAARAGRA